ncbi:hypothetical protein DFH06DRAFT_1194838 [Mycena polygramma]|nr:hypothetical protein DFH06DRAFT_1194838 [Mycena polygramma]
MRGVFRQIRLRGRVVCICTCWISSKCCRRGCLFDSGRSYRMTRCAFFYLFSWLESLCRMSGIHVMQSLRGISQCSASAFRMQDVSRLESLAIYQRTFEILSQQIRLRSRVICICTSWNCR